MNLILRSVSPAFRLCRYALNASLFVGTAISALGQSFGDFDQRQPFLPTPARSVTTVPASGAQDVNPYGVAFIDENFRAGEGPLHHRDVLVSNYNGPANLQGTGTSIVRIPTKGSPSVFFRSTGVTGLSTALGTLRKGFVLVGSFPTIDGTAATASAGSLLVINNQGQQIQSFTGADIQGPWDMALVDDDDVAFAFISNALTGTIARLNFQVTNGGLKLLSSTTVASGYLHRADPAALFVAPTGLVYDDRRDVLYVASTEDNEVFAVPNALERTQSTGTGRLIYQDNLHLHGPLGMAMAPNGHLVVANSDVINADPNQPSELVEFTTDGRFVKELSVDPNVGGSFGLAIHAGHNGAVFAAVDDNTATITIWQIPAE